MSDKKLEVIRDAKTGYPDVKAMLAQMDSWTAEEKFANQFWRLNNLYKIVDKNARVVTFVMKPEQADLHCDPHKRHVILKVRQLGFSTYVQLKWLDRGLFNSNEALFVIAQDKDTAAAIMETKIKFAYDNLPEQIKKARPIVRSNASEFVIGHERGNSTITVSTSARSRTATGIHSSEMAKTFVMDPAKTREFFTGSLQALVPEGDCYIESTAEGAVGDFYDAYQGAFDAPQSPMAFKRHFYSWYLTPEYESPRPPEGGIDKELARYFDELEQELGIKLSPEKKNWYAGKQKELKFQMKQEYPSTAKEAFEVSAEGLVWGEQLRVVRANRRIRPTPYLPNYPAIAVFDIGRTDLAACWCLQYVDEEWRIFGYLEMAKADMAWFLEKFAARGWKFMWLILPHDAEQKRFQMEDRPTLVQECINWGYNAIAWPKTDNKIRDIFNAGKFMLECRFNDDDASGVPDGLERLGAYRFARRTDGTWTREPKHDANSNGSDAFRYISVCSQFIIGEVCAADMDEATERARDNGNRRANPMTGY